ncbi:MAG: diaminopimelate epimerase [Actinomycetota bacterium]
MAALSMVKGHGTENDFLIISDPDGTLQLDAATVVHWCDRHRGIGADGLIVAAPGPLAGYDTRAAWFMDYRNADGSLAEMCGNGIRVMVAFLRHRGLIRMADGESLVIATRGGDRRVWVTGDEYTVDMGDFSLPGGTDATLRGFDVAVKLPGLDQRPGLSVAMPNPHTVVALDSEAALDALVLDDVRYDPEPPEGTNLEVVVPLGETSAGRGALRMRVLERGVGETRSCGTGCCAAAVAVREWAGAGAPDEWDVTVPGGTLRVRVEGQRVLLTGPAVLVAEVTPLAAPPAP